VSREQAAENRRAIVAAATRLFRERGVEAVGLSELMKQAGFTQGGFYNHFESKADLVAEVLASAIAEGNAEFAKMARAPVDESTIALRALHKLVSVASPPRQHRSRLSRHRICWRCSSLGHRSTVALRRRIGRSDNDPGRTDRREWIFGCDRRA
jgi:AcrR family transcriptional regulator